MKLVFTAEARIDLTRIGDVIARPGLWSAERHTDAIVEFPGGSRSYPHTEDARSKGSAARASDYSAWEHTR